MCVNTVVIDKDTGQKYHHLRKMLTNTVRIKSFYINTILHLCYVSLILGKNPNKMSKILYCMLVASTIIITLANCAKVEVKKDEMTMAPAVQRMDQDMEDSTEAKDYDLKAVMKDCNESFIVEMCMFFF